MPEGVVMDLEDTKLTYDEFQMFKSCDTSGNFVINRKNGYIYVSYGSHTFETNCPSVCWFPLLLSLDKTKLYHLNIFDLEVYDGKSQQMINVKLDRKFHSFVEYIGEDYFLVYNMLEEFVFVKYDNNKFVQVPIPYEEDTIYCTV